MNTPPGSELSPTTAGVDQSSQPTTGQNYDTLAEDLHELVTHLKLSEFTRVEFSMGEVKFPVTVR
jgi:hypothetical protein